VFAPLESLAGTWEMIHAEFAGEKAPEFVVLKTEVAFTAVDYVVRFAGETADRGTYTLDLACTPHALTLTGVEGPNAGRTIPCLFQLAGDRLRVCYGLDGVVPAVFTTAAGTQRYLATYRRKTPAVTPGGDR